MAMTIAQKISASIASIHFFTIMVYDCTNVANMKLFMVCIHWVDETLTDHQDVIGVYNVAKIDTDTLTAAIRDMLLHMNLKMSQCHGQGVMEEHRT